MGEGCGHGCDCNPEDEEQKTFDCGEDDCEEDLEEETAYAHDRLDALVGVMIKKGLITEAELEEEYNKIVDERESLED